MDQWYKKVDLVSNTDSNNVLTEHWIAENYAVQDLIVRSGPPNWDYWVVTQVYADDPLSLSDLIFVYHYPFFQLTNPDNDWSYTTPWDQVLHFDENNALFERYTDPTGLATYEAGLASLRYTDPEKYWLFSGIAPRNYWSF
jgi:hypothetical protein